MDLFYGILKVIEEKGLRKKDGVSPEGRHLAYWLDGWPTLKPTHLLKTVFYDAQVRTHIFTETFGPDNCPQLLARLVCDIEEIRKRGFERWELHVTTSVEDWLSGEEWCSRSATEQMQARLQASLCQLKVFVADLCGECAGARVFYNVDGDYCGQERKSICKLLISNL